MSLKLNSSGGGSITLQEPSTASNRTLTLPDNTGTVVSTASTGVITQAMIATGVAGTGSVVYATRTTSQTIAASTSTKVLFPNEVTDLNNEYASSRFTPTVPGYYLITATLFWGGSVNGAYSDVAIFINGNSIYTNINQLSSSFQTTVTVIGIPYLNGTTDYAEIYCAQATGNNLNVLAPSRFQAVLVRAA